ncbi:MAG: DUF2231 domain-containing protein [Balneolaceae bacterium]
MPTVPDMWRAELWHPMVVHFPIALLLGAAVLRWIHLATGRNRFPVLYSCSKGMLVVGALFSWLAIYTGDIADSIVTRALCDPTVLEAHEQLAMWTAFLFTIAAILDLIHDYWKWNDWKGSFATWTVAILLLAGSAGLSYTAHLGASLVYQQGAAVYHPTDGCTEFD